MSVLLLVIGIVLFISLIVVHEYGHFIMARRNGVEVEEFGIFFPPAIYRHKTKGGWDFTINAIPLGGFVRLKGEHDSDTEPGTFGAASLGVKSKIMVAGVAMNLITALILLTIIALIGMPKLIKDQFTVASDTQVVSSKVILAYIEPGSPAAKAGLKQGDHLVGYSGASCDKKICSLTQATDLSKATRSQAGTEIKLEYKRQGKTQVAIAKLLDTKTVEASKKTDNPKGYLGVVPREYVIQRSTWSAPVVAVGFAAQVTQITFEGLGRALSGLGSLIVGAVTGNTEARQHGQTKASEDVSGPVGIFVVLRDGTLLGFQFILFIIAIISLTLAIMNILPIPALDGGRLWLTLIARGLNRPLSAKTEELINGIGFLILLGLIFVITYVDVKRFF